MGVKCLLKVVRNDTGWERDDLFLTFYLTFSASKLNTALEIRIAKYWTLIMWAVLDAASRPPTLNTEHLTLDSRPKPLIPQPQPPNPSP